MNDPTDFFWDMLGLGLGGGIFFFLALAGDGLSQIGRAGRKELEAKRDAERSHG